MPKGVWDVMANGKFTGIKVSNFPYDSKYYADKGKQNGKKYYLRPEGGDRAPDVSDIDSQKGVLIARWATRGNRYWYELYRFPYGLSYYEDHGGGNLGSMSVRQAKSYLEGIMADAGLIDGINYSMVYPEERVIEASKTLEDLPVVPNRIPVAKKAKRSKQSPSGFGGVR